MKPSGEPLYDDWHQLHVDTEYSHWTWYTPDAVRHNCPSVVFDVDGVLADATHRQHLAQGRHKNWPQFIQAAKNDAPILEKIELLNNTLPGTLRVLLTGRPLTILDTSVLWLATHGVKWDLLIMRPTGVYSPARESKAVEVARLQDRGIDITCIYDDDRRNCDVFERLGLTTVYVESGYYNQLSDNNADGFSGNMRS